MTDLSRSAIAARDASDPLAAYRDRFALPDGVIYLDGNSLGALPRKTAARLSRAIKREWGVGLIRSWNDADWVNAPRRIGDKIARLIGAAPGEVVVADSTSVNLFKALTAACSLNPDRTVILSEAGNFPTDAYMMQGLAAFSGGRLCEKLVSRDAVLDALDATTAVLLLTQTHYKSGQVWDLAETTRRAHDAGAIVVWDLSHSAGAIEVDLNGANADFAVGCGYKFLNGGPGAPAFFYAATRHHERAAPVLSGWFGHRAPFAFDDRYAPAPGVERFLCGTPAILGMVALESGVDLFAEVDMTAVRAKSAALGDLFIALMEARCADHGFALASPRDAGRRGSHVSYAHPEGYAIMQALKARGVIGDFRTPDVLRFGLTPLYLRFQDIDDAVAAIADVMESEAWRAPEYATRAAVT